MSEEERIDALVKVINRLTVLTILILFIVASSIYFFNDIEKIKDRFSYLSTLVFISGVIGGFVSLQQRLHRISDEELILLSKSLFAIAVVPINGGIFAYTLMLMFMGKIVQGNLFPTFPDMNIYDIASFKAWLMYSLPINGADMAKLLFWSFVAGFSERFVPRMINATVGSRTKSNMASKNQDNTANDMTPKSPKKEEKNG